MKSANKPDLHHTFVKVMRRVFYRKRKGEETYKGDLICTEKFANNLMVKVAESMGLIEVADCDSEGFTHKMRWQGEPWNPSGERPGSSVNDSHCELMSGTLLHNLCNESHRRGKVPLARYGDEYVHQVLDWLGADHVDREELMGLFHKGRQAYEATGRELQKSLNRLNDKNREANYEEFGKFTSEGYARLKERLDQRECKDMEK